MNPGGVFAAILCWRFFITNRIYSTRHSRRRSSPVCHLRQSALVGASEIKIQKDAPEDHNDDVLTKLLNPSLHQPAGQPRRQLER